MIAFKAANVSTPTQTTRIPKYVFAHGLTKWGKNILSLHKSAFKHVFFL